MLGRKANAFVDIGYERPRALAGMTLQELKTRMALSEGEKIRGKDGESYIVVHNYPFYVLCRDRQGRLCGLLYQDIREGA